MTSPENYPGAPQGSYPPPVPGQAPYAGTPAGAPLQAPPPPGYQAQPTMGAPMAPPAMPSYAAPDSLLAKMLNSIVAPANLATVVITFGIALGVSWLFALVALVGAPNSKFSFQDWGLIANFILSGGFSASKGGIIGWTFFSTVWLIIAGATYYVARARSANETTLDAQWILLRGFVEAFVISLALALLSLFFSNHGNGPAFAPLLFVSWLILGLSLYVGRRHAVGARVLPAALDSTRRELVSAFLPIVLIHSVLVLVQLLVTSIKVESIAPFGLGLAFFPGFVLASFSMSLFGTLTPLKGSKTVGLDSFIGNWQWLVIVLFILVMLTLIPVRVGTVRQRTATPQWERVWQLPTATLVLSLLLVPTVGRISEFYVTPIAILILPLVMLVVSAAAEVVPALLYSVSPAVVQTLAGKKNFHVWINALDPATGQPPVYTPAPAAAPVAAPVPAQGYAYPAPAEAPMAAPAPEQQYYAPQPGAPAPEQQYYAPQPGTPVPEQQYYTPQPGTPVPEQQYYTPQPGAPAPAPAPDQAYQYPAPQADQQYPPQA